MGTVNKRQIGSSYEQIAMDYLKRQGLVILERNYHCRSGELDLIAKDGTYLVFAEVKYRASEKRGNPLEAVNHQKQQHIRQAARYYLYQHGYAEDTPCRFDVIGILGTELIWLRDAF